MPLTPVRVVPVLALLLALSAPLAHAQEEPTPAPSPEGAAASDDAAPARPFTAESELGAVLTEGNTRTTTAKARVAASYAVRRFRIGGDADALYAEDRERTTAQRIAAALKAEYTFTDRMYAFATGRYEDDRFSGFDYTVTEAAGIGRKLIEGPPVSLDVEAGPGGRHRRLDDGRHEDDLIVRAASRLAWQISQSATASETVRVEVGEQGSETESVTALETRITGYLALKLSFTLTHRTEVPPDTRSVDTVTAVTLVFRY